MEDVNSIQELVELLYRIETRYPGSPLLEVLKEIIKKENPQYHPLISIF